MRIGEFKKDLKNILQQKHADISCDNFICIEILLQVVYSMKQKPEDGWLLLTQYYKLILSEKIIGGNSRILYGLRKKCHHFANKLNWQRVLKQYFSLSSDVRMFSCQDNSLKKLSLKYLPNRQDVYEDICQSFLENKIVKPFLLKSVQAKYYKVIRNNIKKSSISTDKIEKYFKLPNELLKEYKNELPLYREKKQLYIPKSISWKHVYTKMKNGWEKRPEFKIINEFSQTEQDIFYKDQVHIIGEVGQGKSNYKIAETYRLVTEYDAKVGIVESNVDEVIKTTKALRELGINAVPVIGKSNLEKHLNNYIRNLGREVQKIGDFSDENCKELEWLSGICTIGALAQDNEISPREFPCNKLIDDEDETKVCPIYHNCGYFKRFLALPEAQVWVATPYSLINTSIPKVIDPYERTFYEAFHDLLDIIIVDEADGVQRVLDSLFLNKEDLTDGNDSIMERFEKLDKIITSKNMANKESLAYTWQINFGHLKLLIPKIARMVANTEVLHNYLRREIITSFNLFSDVKSGFKIEDYPENQEIVRKIEQYYDYADTYDIKSDSISHEFNELYNEFLLVQNLGIVEEKISEKIKAVFHKYNVSIPGQKNEELFYAKFELFIYLVQLDFYIKVLSRDYPILMDRLNNNYEKINVYEGARKSLRTFLTEPMTGILFGYKFVPADKESAQKIHIFRYSGVGRRLLDHSHEIKKEIGINGPAVVLLSGTSVAPGSGHYDLLKKPEYILKSFETNSRIEQKVVFKYDENGELLRVSGLKGEERAKSLRKLTKSLLRDIRIELNYWKNVDDAEIRNRKVLMVVNSYDNCKEVGKALSGSGITYRVLSRECEEEMDFQKELLNGFSNESDNADVLVAPMNVICRGYNILNKYGKSYFGSVFFLVRPYMVPDDLESYFQILHSNLNRYIDYCINKNLDLGEAMKEIRKKSYSDLNKIVQNKYWRHLDKEFRKNLAWFTLVPIKQTIGRLQRGGTDCRVFYCDGAFALEAAKGELLTRENSMLIEWYEILKEGRESLFIKELYGKFLNGLEEMIEELNAEQMEEENYE